MDFSLKQVGAVLLYVFTGCAIFIAITLFATDAGSQMNTAFHNQQITHINDELLLLKKPNLNIEHHKTTWKQAFDKMKDVTATQFDGRDITNRIEVFGEVDTQVKGEYDLLYTVEDFQGMKTKKLITIVVD